MLCIHVLHTTGVNSSQSTMRRILKNLDYAWKRPRHTTVRNRDKNAKQKVDAIIKALSNTRLKTIL